MTLENEQGVDSQAAQKKNKDQGELLSAHLDIKIIDQTIEYYRSLLGLIEFIELIHQSSLGVCHEDAIEQFLYENQQSPIYEYKKKIKELFSPLQDVKEVQEISPDTILDEYRDQNGNLSKIKQEISQHLLVWQKIRIKSKIEARKEIDWEKQDIEIKKNNLLKQNYQKETITDWGQKNIFYFVGEELLRSFKQDLFYEEKKLRLILYFSCNMPDDLQRLKENFLSSSAAITGCANQYFDDLLAELLKFRIKHKILSEENIIQELDESSLTAFPTDKQGKLIAYASIAKEKYSEKNISKLFQEMLRVLAVIEEKALDSHKDYYGFSAQESFAPQTDHLELRAQELVNFVANELMHKKEGAQVTKVEKNEGKLAAVPAQKSKETRSKQEGEEVIPAKEGEKVKKEHEKEESLQTEKIDDEANNQEIKESSVEKHEKRKNEKAEKKQDVEEDNAKALRSSLHLSSIPASLTQQAKTQVSAVFSSKEVMRDGFIIAIIVVLAIIFPPLMILASIAASSWLAFRGVQIIRNRRQAMRNKKEHEPVQVGAEPDRVPHLETPKAAPTTLTGERIELKTNAMLRSRSASSGESAQEDNQDEQGDGESPSQPRVH